MINKPIKTGRSELTASMQAMRLPRYTSYPPATQFSDMTPATQAQWLAALPSDEAISLYLHIPYCDQLCYFCGCFTTITHRYEPVQRYLSLLLAEIEWLAKIIGKVPVNYIHMGGGSPTALSANDFKTLLNTLSSKFNLSNKAEIAVEIDPRTVDEEKIKAFADSGVTRASLGVQDFNKDVQQAVNRIQPYEMVADVVEQLRKHSINDINLDLMYGLPLQTVASVTKTAQQALTLEPSRMAVFGYAHVPWMRKHQKVLDDYPMADVEQRLQMFAAIREVFTRNDYIAIGIDHYAKKDDSLTMALENKTMHRNFQGYTTDSAKTLVGLGLSAISSLDQGYIQNTSSIKEYKQRIEQNTGCAIKGLPVSSEDKMRRKVISDLMCFYKVDLAGVKSQFASTASFASELQELQSLQETGVVQLDKQTVIITDEGKPYVRLVASIFDQYIKGNESRFSLAL